MALTLFKPINTALPDLNRVQANMDLLSQSLGQNPLLRGHLLTDISIAASPDYTQVEHKLGREPLGWIITDITASATIYRVDNSALATRYLTLASNNATTINLWVF